VTNAASFEGAVAALAGWVAEDWAGCPAAAGGCCAWRPDVMRASATAAKLVRFIRLSSFGSPSSTEGLHRRWTLQLLNRSSGGVEES
jgi:hypothetical protein